MEILELHQMGHENLCAFSEISSAPVCAIINDHSLILKYLQIPNVKSLKFQFNSFSRLAAAFRKHEGLHPPPAPQCYWS